MNIVLWVIAGLLAAVFAAAGVMKLTQPATKLAASGMGWTDDVSPAMVKTIGVVEVLAAVGLIVPGAVHVVAVLVPVAAVGLIALMIGAAVTHLRRHELAMVAVNVVLLALAAVVVWGRFGPHRFS